MDQPTPGPTHQHQHFKVITIFDLGEDRVSFSWWCGERGELYEEARCTLSPLPPPTLLSHNGLSSLSSLLSQPRQLKEMFEMCFKTSIKKVFLFRGKVCKTNTVLLSTEASQSFIITFPPLPQTSSRNSILVQFTFLTQIANCKGLALWETNPCIPLTWVSILVVVYWFMTFSVFGCLP